MATADQIALENLCNRTYKEQAIWFLNSFWSTHGEANSEQVWAFTHKFAELDHAKKANGNELDELNAHRFLEAFKDPLTVKQMRDKLRAKGALKEVGVSKYVPLTHYLVVHFDVDFHTLVNAPQGDPEQVKEAQRRLDEVNKALAECQQKASEARIAANQARAAEAESKKREEAAMRAESEAKARESAAKRAEQEAVEREAEAIKNAEAAKLRQQELEAAQRELEAALAEVKKEEDAYNNRTEELKRLSEEGGAVARGKAKNELAQHLSAETLPLKKAKITAEAAVKRAEKATTAAAEASSLAEASAIDASEARSAAQKAAADASAARKAAEEAARAATAAREAAEKARAAADAAQRAVEEQLIELEVALQEAENYLEKVKKTIGRGAIWWIEREILEARKYKPLSKGGIAK